MHDNEESLDRGRASLCSIDDPMHFTCWEAVETLLLHRRLRSYCVDGVQPAGSGCVTSAAEEPPGAHVRAHARAQCRRHPDCTAGSAWRTSLWFSGTRSYSDLQCTFVDGCCCWIETPVGYSVAACCYSVVACCYHQVVLTSDETLKCHY